MSSDLLHFNGVHASTGSYGLQPMSAQELMMYICRQPEPNNLDDLRVRKEQDDRKSDRVRALESELNSHKQRLASVRVGSTEYREVLRRCEALQREIDLRKDKGVKEGIDATQLSQAGWGVIFAHDADPAIKEALWPLLELRREQAGPLFKIYEGAAGYRPGESKARFLTRHGADAAGPADPRRVPYYLLIVGSPEKIPFAFQYQLDVQYAVGRVHFEKLVEYAAYARTVQQAELHGIPLPRRLSFFGVSNPDDPSTQLSQRHLVQPLHEALARNSHGFSVDVVPPTQANRATLAAQLGGAETPALLFTASHGVEFSSGDPRQLAHQGALLCQDWPGPRHHGAFKEDFYFAGEHLSHAASLRGMMVFGFACYGAGTPKLDEFGHQSGNPRQRKSIAPKDFVAALPQRLLGHPGGGSLAFIGHVDRAWGYSYTWPGARNKSQTAAFESVLLRLLQGQPVGYALEYFNERYAELSTVLTQQLQDIDHGMECDPYELAAMWTANNDSRGYVVLGDPAVRLRFSSVPGDSLLVQSGAMQHGFGTLPSTAHTQSDPGDVPALLSNVSREDWSQTPDSVKQAILRLCRERSPL